VSLTVVDALGVQEHYQSGGGSLQAISWEDDQAPWEVEGDDRLKNVYEANAPIIPAK
jgi:hypothetical protein